MAKVLRSIVVPADMYRNAVGFWGCQTIVDAACTCLPEQAVHAVCCEVIPRHQTCAYALACTPRFKIVGNTQTAVCPLCELNQTDTYRSVYYITVAVNFRTIMKVFLDFAG